MTHTNMLDCHLRCHNCGASCAAHAAGSACPAFTPPESLSVFADEAQLVLAPIAEHSGATLLVLVMGPGGELELRSTAPNLDVNAAVGALYRAAQTVHTLRSHVTYVKPGEPGEPGEPDKAAP